MKLLIIIKILVCQVGTVDKGESQMNPLCAEVEELKYINKENSNPYYFLMKNRSSYVLLSIDEIFKALQLANNQKIIPPISKTWINKMLKLGYTFVDDKTSNCAKLAH